MDLPMNPVAPEIDTLMLTLPPSHAPRLDVLRPAAPLCFFHVAGRPAATSSMLRPDATESGASSTIAEPGRDASSRCLMSSQFLSPRPFICTRVQLPVSLCPCRMNLSSPVARSRAASVSAAPAARSWAVSDASRGAPVGPPSFVRGRSGSHHPKSQRTTVPPPYSPSGMVPSKLPYSSGWSSVMTANRLSVGSREGPFGTAHDLSLIHI